MTDTGSTLVFREAQHDDLQVIITMLSDDALGVSRDGLQHLPAYEAAFLSIQEQAGNSLIVATQDEEIVGVLQLTLIPGLSRAGMLRAQIESVRVSGQHRGQRIGKALFQYAIQQAKDAGCGLVQLTTDKQRTNALRFYEDMGFKASHEGLKLML